MKTFTNDETGATSSHIESTLEIKGYVTVGGLATWFPGHKWYSSWVCEYCGLSDVGSMVELSKHLKGHAEDLKNGSPKP